MEFSNKLLTSLRQDIKILNNVIKDVLEKVTYVGINSWLYPTKGYSDTLKLNLVENKCKEKLYLNSLEFIIDRLYLIINLFKNYIEGFPSFPKQDKLKNVAKPNKLSLGAVTNLFWKSIKDLREKITMDYELSQKKVCNNQKHDKQTIHNETQTDSCESNQCISCDIAESCIKEIANELENNTCALFINSTRLATPKLPLSRKDLQENIFDITQHGCMNRLTVAIIKDFKSFTELLKGSQIKNKENVLKLKKLNAKYLNSMNIIKSAEVSLMKMQKRSKRVKMKNRDLIKNINDLTEVNKDIEIKLSHERRKLGILEISLQENLTTIALLSTNNEALHRDIKECLEEKINVSNERNSWKNRFTQLYLENRDLKLEVQELRNELKEVKDIDAKCGELIKKLDRYNSEILLRTKNFENEFKILMDTVSLIKTMRNDLNGLKNENETSFQIIGDPITDMRKQIEVNALNIKKLEKNNMDLLKTIHRVQEQRFIKMFI